MHGQSLGIQSFKIILIEGGFPHSEICGSKVVRTSPQLIAAYHVFHRLLLPRHPPNALMALDHSHHRCSSSRDRCRKTSFTLLHSSPTKKRHPEPKHEAPELNIISGLVAGSATIGDDLLTMTNSSVHTSNGRTEKPRLSFECFSQTGDLIWWSQTGSNRRHPACKAGALPAELWPRSDDRQARSSSPTAEPASPDANVAQDNGGPGRT